MTTDVANLLMWIQVCLWVAAVCATAFPLLYLFSPWFRSSLGRWLMMQGVAFAVAIDTTLLFQYWTPDNVIVVFWVNAFVFTLAAVATAGLTLMLWRSNYKHRKRVKEFIKNEQ